MSRRMALRVPPIVVVAALTCLAPAGPASARDRTHAPRTKPVTVTLMTHDSFAVSKSVLHAFTARTGVTVKLLPSGDAGQALNKAILTKDHPLADAFFGVDNTLLSRAATSGIFETYRSPQLAHTRPDVRLDASSKLTPIDYGDVCINYDKQYFALKQPPSTLDDLTKPEYRGLLAIENPATSSTGLAFLLGTVARYGTNGWARYWKRLLANDVKVDDGWDQAYDTDFSGSAGKGPRPLVVSYASSPPAEVYYAKTPPKAAPTGVMTASCFRQVEFAGILNGTKHRAAAAQLIDFMLSKAFQEDVPLQMFVYPARPDAKLPPVFVRYSVVTKHPLQMSPATIARHRDQWIEQWTKLYRG